MKALKSLPIETKTIMTVVFSFAILMIGDVASAITAPSSGSFAYTVYDIGVQKILKGPVGFVGGVVAIVIGAIMAMRAQVLPAVASILGGGVLLGADSIVSSMGTLIQ